MQDDRGKPVEVMRRAGFCAWPLEGDERISHLLRRMAVAIRSGWNHWRFLLVMMVMPVLVVLLGVAMPMLLRMMPGVPAWAPLVLMGATIGTTVRLVMRWRIRRGAGKVLALVLEEGLCGSCGYNMVGLPVESDGRLVCPECSAAWKLERVRERAAFAPGAKMGDPWTVLSRRRARPVLPMKDDRSRPVEAAPPRLRAALRDARPFPERHAKLSRAKKAILREGRAVRWLIVGLLGLVVFVAPVVLYVLTGGTGAWWTPLLIVPSAVPMALLVWRGRVGFRASAVKRALLGEGLCPSCAAELREDVVGPDGRRECPVCRSAWGNPGQDSAVRSLS